MYEGPDTQVAPESPALKAVKWYLYFLGALSAVRVFFMADAQLTRFLDQRSVALQIADGIERTLGAGSLFALVGGTVFSFAAGPSELEQAYNALGFYLMSPLLLASFTEFSKGSSLTGPLGTLARVIGYFLLYGVGFFFLGALWPAFVVTALFMRPRYSSAVLLRVQAETWIATLWCLAAVALAVLIAQVA